MADSPSESAAPEPRWPKEVDDLVAADRRGEVVYRCVGCHARFGVDEHEPDCEEVRLVTGE